MIQPIRIRQHDDFRLPSTAGPGLEAKLAAVNDALRARAVESLAELVPGLDLAAFAQATDSAPLTISRFESASIVERLDPIGFLDRYLGATHLLSPGQIRLARSRELAPSVDYLTARREWPIGRSIVNQAGLIRALRSGHSVILDGLDGYWSELAEITCCFERVFGWKFNVNGYLSATPTQAFGTHWDDHEVVIVQLINSKRWAIAPPENPSMVASLHPNENRVTMEATWDGLFTVGMGMYIPRGWAHAVQATEGLTFHITVSCKRPTVLDMMRFQARSLSDGAPICVGDLLGEQGDRLVRDFTDSLVGDESLEPTFSRFAAQMRLRMPARFTRGSLRMAPLLESDSSCLRDPYGGGWLILGQPVEGEAEIAAGGSAWRCEEETLSLLLAVARAGALTLEDARRFGFGAAVLEDVANQGLLELVPG